MKSILYVGATLMIGASIYGFVDYKKTSQQKEFTGMYESNEINSPEIKEVKNLPVTGKNDPVTEKVTGKNIVPGNAVINTAVVKEATKEKKSKPVKRRKLNYKQFSRAPLREELRVINPEDQKKEEAVKPRVENKEQ